MDTPLSAPDALIRPWRTATLVASLVAAIELVLLLCAGFLLLAKPLTHAMQKRAAATAFAPAKKDAAARVVHKQAPVGLPKLLRSETGVFVFNGNGRSGAASSESAKLANLNYRVPGTGNAKRQDYATSVVMFKQGFHAEGARLARDLRVKIVGPLDGLKPSALRGAQLALVLGAQ
ncbi:MAG: LytR C-terminal domain-containing protein [Gaiellaceae bacterium]